ncbi:MAG: hypothetical protein WCI43_01780 [Candidatus Firestonebacteria bacterium]
MEFHVTFDFGDDILYAKQEWTEDWLRQIVRGYAERGVSAIHWIHSHGAFSFPKEFPGSKRYRFEGHIPDPLAVIADESHKNGMRCFSVIKINDRAIGMPFSPRKVTYNAKGEIEQDFLGGKFNYVHPWTLKHPEMRAGLHPSLQEKLPRKPVTAIRLWHEGPNLPETPFEIYVSKDNRNYTLYTGSKAVKFSERRRTPPVFVPAPDSAFGPEGTFTCIEFSGLNITEPFFAVMAGKPTELANTMSALVEIVDTEGKQAAFTYGLVPVIPDMMDQSQKEDWRNIGIAFDAAFGTSIPGRGFHFMTSGGRHRIEIKKRGFLGFARGKNRFLTGIQEYSYPEARNNCVQIVKEAFDSGCDAVDIRVNSHTESFDWENYGFGGPIVLEYKTRYGQDITRDKFDRAKWRALRGEYLTQALTEMSEFTRSCGKEFSIQFFDFFDHTAEELCKMEFYWDWKKWLTGGLVDSATLASFEWKSAFYADILELSHQQKIPLRMTPAMHSATEPDWERDLPIYLDACKRDGLKVFNIYESAAVSQLDTDGLRYKIPFLWKTIKEQK